MVADTTIIVHSDATCQAVNKTYCYSVYCTSSAYVLGLFHTRTIWHQSQLDAAGRAGRIGRLRPDRKLFRCSSKLAGFANSITGLELTGLEHAVDDIILHSGMRIKVLWAQNVLCNLLRIVLRVSRKYLDLQTERI